MGPAAQQNLKALASQLGKEVLENPEPLPKTSRDLLEELKDVKISIEILESTRIGKTLNKAIKSFKRHKRTAADDSIVREWEELIESSEELLRTWKATVDNEAKQQAKKKKADVDISRVGYPNNVSEYKSRLVKQRKEMYKDPPVLPPGGGKGSDCWVKEGGESLPKRDKSTGRLKFSGSDPAIQDMLKDFQPNRTPEEVLRAGSFGGTYFRTIVSAVTNQQYKGSEALKDTVPFDWISGLNTGTMLTSSVYREHVNKFGVKCGGSLGMWESSGWISEIDPYGWFQWYCRFYQGRRSFDDARQISRWLKCAGPKGRFRSQLCNKILQAKTKHDDKSISPVIRQTLLHWGLEIEADVLEKHRKRMKM